MKVLISWTGIRLDVNNDATNSGSHLDRKQANFEWLADISWCRLDLMIRSSHKLHQLPIPKPSLRQAKYFHRCRLRIAEKDRINVLHDVGANIQKIALVLNGNQRTLRAVVHGYLQWLCQ